MRKNIYDNNVVMINTNELILLEKYEESEAIKVFYNYFYNKVLKCKNGIIKRGNKKYISFGININDINPYSKKIITELSKNDFDNPHDYIYVDYLMKACIDYIDDSYIAKRLKRILMNNFKDNQFALLKEDLLKDNDKYIINFLLAYQDTNMNIEKDNKIILYRDNTLHGIENTKVKQKKRNS